MTVKELIEELSKYPKDTEVLTKKTSEHGNVGGIANVHYDFYGDAESDWSVGIAYPCVLLTDES